MANVLDPEYVSMGFGLGLPILTYLYLFMATKPRWIRTAPRPQVGEEPELPQKIRPALAGLFFDGKLDEHEIAATIVDLFIKGYLGVLDKGDKIVIIRQKSIEGLPFFEYQIARHLINKESIAKSELEIEARINRKLYDEHISEALRSLYQEGVEHRFFFEDPNWRYAWYYLAGLVLFFLGLGTFIVLLGLLFDFPTVLFLPLGLILTGTTIIGGAKRISAMGPGGRLIQETWHDYRQELAHFQPKGKPEVYLQYLPYAFALAVENEWTTRWKDQVFRTPNWFTSFGAPTSDEFLAKLRPVVYALARNLFALRDPAFRD